MSKIAANKSETIATASSLPGGIGVALWILLVIAGFWGPYLRLPISTPLLTGIYGIFVLVAAASAALRFLRRGDNGAK